MARFIFAAILAGLLTDCSAAILRGLRAGQLPKALDDLVKKLPFGSEKPTKREHPSFELVRQEQVDEYQVNFTLYKHIKTGAEIMSVEADDDNKVFGVAFRTPVSDSTGIAHIMEHSVLCGSRKYPVKDPFIQLRRTSLQTYLNAMTYPDRTVYPVASQNLKDFYNLANVYLDAVLHPRAVEDPMVLAQEGWHFELNKESDPLIYKGIVFNEMKGAGSSPEAKLQKEAMAAMFPNTTYRFNSGGDPKYIPDITFDMFKAYYQQYYHPSNGRFYFYGDDPVEGRLDLLDSYLSEFGQPPEPVEVTRIETQKMWKSPRRVEAAFPVTAQQAEAKGGAKHMFEMYWLLNEEPLPHAEQLAMSVVNSLLLGSSTSPLYKALVRSGLGESVMGGGYSGSLKQSTYSTGLKGVSKENVPKVETLIMDTLRAVVKKGFTKEEVEATMNSLEFGLREFSSASTNMGMSIFLNAASDWIYERDPIQGLKFQKPFNEIKDALAKDGQRYLEDLIEKYLINNPHRLSLEGVPDATMVAREEAEEKKVLTDARAAMSKAKIEEVVKETAELTAEQKSVDTKEQLDTLPKLSIKDLTKKDVDFDISIGEKQGVKVLTHDVATAGLVYVQLVLDLSVLPVDYLKFLPILTGLLFDVGTSKLSPEDFTNKIGAHTGGISAGSLNALKYGKDGVVGDPNDIAFRLIVSGKATADNAAALFDLMHMGLTDSKLDSKDRVLENLKSTKASMDSSLKSAGNSYAQSRMYARRSLSGYIDEVTGGITFFESLPALLEMAEKDWPSLLAKLKTMSTLLLQKKSMLINLSGDKKTLETVDPHVDTFLKSLLATAEEHPQPKVEGPTVADAMKGKTNLRLKEEDEGFVVVTPVNYVVKGGGLFSEGDHISATTDVVVRQISQSYMWDKVRVMGGAYGGGCSLSHLSGTFSCYSYRDPNLKKTIDTFDAVASYLENLKLSDADIEQLVIGAVGELDKPISPSSKGYTSLVRYLVNNKLESRAQRRQEMMSTNAESFKEFAKHMRKATASFRNSIFGSTKAFEKANKALAEDKQIPLIKLQ
jgi:hypothetical protein